MNLPAPLAPWAPYLEEFPLEVGPILGAMAGQIAALLGPLGSDFEAPDGEVDGYDGLSRRGLPERMLLSEWLLASEAPDEWSRRAAEGELSYLQLARRAPQQSLAMGALFDAGPDALGAPRLGQLAALLVLSRRAGQMGAALQWGVVQDENSRVWPGFSPSSVRALLAARSGDAATEIQLEKWRETLGECDELWLIGGETIAEIATPRDSTLRFDDPFEALLEDKNVLNGSLNSGHFLEATARPARGLTRRARLELPPGGIATRLLRDPLGSSPDASTQTRRLKPNSVPTSNLLWIGVNTLAANTRDGGVVLFRIPSSPRGGVGKPKHFHRADGRRIHFFGEVNGGFLAGHLASTRIDTARVGGKLTGLAAAKYDGQFRVSDAPLRPIWSLSARAPRSLLFVVCDEELLELEFDPAREEAFRGKVASVSTGIKAAAHGGGTILGLATGVPDLKVPPKLVMLHDALRAGDDYRNSSEIFPEGAGTEATAPSTVISEAFWGNFFGNSLGRTQKILAFHTDKWWLRWTENGKIRYHGLEVPRGQFVRGVVASHPKFSSPALVLCGSNARGLELWGVGWKRHLPTDDAILRVSTSPVMPYIAWTTPTELCVYSLAQEEILARWQWEATP